MSFNAIAMGLKETLEGAVKKVKETVAGKGNESPNGKPEDDFSELINSSPELKNYCREVLSKGFKIVANNQPRERPPFKRFRKK